MLKDLKIDGKKTGTRNMFGMCVRLEKSNNKETDGRFL